MEFYVPIHHRVDTEPYLFDLLILLMLEGFKTFGKACFDPFGCEEPKHCVRESCGCCSYCCDAATPPINFRNSLRMSGIGGQFRSLPRREYGLVVYYTIKKQA
jgi:hypothetical protein